jgi:hypothetical protein
MVDGGQDSAVHRSTREQQERSTRDRPSGKRDGRSQDKSSQESNRLFNRFFLHSCAVPHKMVQLTKKSFNFYYSTIRFFNMFTPRKSSVKVLQNYRFGSIGTF